MNIQYLSEKKNLISFKIQSLPRLLEDFPGTSVSFGYKWKELILQE